MNTFFKIKNFNYIIALTGYFLIALFILNRILFFSPGTVGFFHDWFIGPYPEMNRIYANGGFYTWDPQIGNKFYYTDWIFRLILIPFSFLDGEVLSKGLLILAITLSGFGAFCLGKRLNLSPYSSFAAGVLYIFSPIIFTRIIAGHIYYLVAYFLSPFVLSFFLKGKEDKQQEEQKEGGAAEKQEVKNKSNKIKIINYKYFIIAGILTSVAVIQIQFLVMIFIVLLVFALVDFGKIKKSLIGLIIIFSVAFMINLSPIVLSDVLYNQTSRFNNPLQLLSYDQIIHSSTLTESLRLLGYSTHTYSYTKIGTLDDPLFESDIEQTGNNRANLVSNPDFMLAVTNNHNNTTTNTQSKLPSNWSDPFGNCNNIFKCIVLKSANFGLQTNSTLDFQISTASTIKDTRSYIVGSQISVKPNENYALVTHMKLNEFVSGSHIVIEGYNATSNKWYQFKTQCPPATNGPLEWQQFNCEITIPANTISIRPVLDAGWSSQSGKEAVTLFNSIDIIRLNDTSVIIPSWIFYLDFLLPIVGFSALIFFRKNKYAISFAVISLIGLFLMKGTSPPLSGIFSFIFTHGFFMFRELWHIAFLYGFGLSFLAAFFLQRLIRTPVFSKSKDYAAVLHPSYRHIFSRLSSTLRSSSSLFFFFSNNRYKNYNKIIICTFLVFLIVLSNGYPLLTANFGGYLQTYNFPKEYHEIYKNLLTSDTYNTLILPVFAPIRYGSLKLSGTDPLLTYSSNNVFGQYPINNPSYPTTGLISWLHSVMQENKTNNLGKLLDGFGIKYIILRKDFISNYPHYVSLGTYDPFTKRWYLSVEPFLDKQKDLVVVSNTSNYKVYENTIDAKKLFVSQIMASGLSDYKSLLYISNFTSLSNIAVYPSDYDNYVKSNKNNNSTDNTGSTYDFIELGKYTISTNPRNGWVTNRDWFGYNYLLASRVHLGAFSMANNSTLTFDVSLPKYKNKTIEMWMRAITWSRGKMVDIGVNEKHSSLSLFSEHPKFALIKIYDGKSKSTDTSYHFSITNISGKNFIEGIYIKEKDQNDKNVNEVFNHQNITDINFDVLNSQRPIIDKYTKLNPTAWGVHINNASKPFVLSFAEPYDSSWEARIYKDGKKVDVTKATPLYGVINGFQINRSGNLDILIRYGPQDWFEVGLGISAICFAFCVGYLFYEYWRTSKGDRRIGSILK